MGATAYTILGVERTATADEIKAAYRAKAAEHHPDAGGGHAKMAKLSLAWRYLGDPEARAKYDRKLDDLERAARAAPVAPTEAPPGEAIDAFLERLRAAQGKGVDAGNLVAELGRAVGLVDEAGLARAQQAATKGASIARDLADLVGLVQGHQR